MIVNDTITTEALAIAKALLVKKAEVVIINSNEWYLDCKAWELHVFEQTQRSVSCHRNLTLLGKFFEVFGEAFLVQEYT